MGVMQQKKVVTSRICLRNGTSTRSQRTCACTTVAGERTGDGRWISRCLMRVRAFHGHCTSSHPLSVDWPCHSCRFETHLLHDSLSSFWTHQSMQGRGFRVARHQSSGAEADARAGCCAVTVIEDGKPYITCLCAVYSRYISVDL